MLAHHAVVHKWLNNVGEKSGNIVLPDFGLIAGDFQSHPDLHIPKLPHELILFRVLAQPSIEEGYQEDEVR